MMKLRVWAGMVDVRMILSNTAIYTACGAVFSNPPSPNKADNSHPTQTIWRPNTNSGSLFFVSACNSQIPHHNPLNVFSPAAADLLLLRQTGVIEMDQGHHTVSLREL